MHRPGPCRPCPSSSPARGRESRRTRPEARRRVQADAPRPGPARRVGLQPADLLALLRPDGPREIGRGIETAGKQGPRLAMDNDAASAARRRGLGETAMDRSVRGQRAQVQEIGRPVRRVERVEDRRPEGRLFARPDQRCAQEHLVMAPVLDEADSGAAIILADGDGQDSDQMAAAPDLDQAGAVPIPASPARRRRTSARRSNWAPTPRRQARSSPARGRRKCPPRIHERGCAARPRWARPQSGRTSRLPGPAASPFSQPDACAADSPKR